MKKLGYMGRDQYGNDFHGLVHPRKDLLERLGRKSARKMYTDTKTGSRHIGYIIGGHWIEIYTVCQWDGPNPCDPNPQGAI